MKLTITIPDAAPRLVDLTEMASDEEWHIGRNNQCSVVLDASKSVSRVHARLIRNGNEWTIEDDSSTNGTYVNGKELTEPHTLNVGEVITIRPYTLTVVA